MADVVITYAAPHHLNADAGSATLRRMSAATRGKPAGRRQLALQSTGSLRSAPLVRYSPLKSALHTDEAAESRCMPAERFVEQLNIQIGHEFAAHPAVRGAQAEYDALTMCRRWRAFYDQALKSATTR